MILHGVSFHFLIKSTSLHLFLSKLRPLHVHCHWEISTNFCQFCWLDYCLFFILSHISIWFTLFDITGSFQLSFVQLVCSASLFFPVWSCDWNFFWCFQCSFTVFCSAGWWSGAPSVVVMLKCPYCFSNSEDHLTCIVVLTGNYLLLRLALHHFMTSWFRVADDALVLCFCRWVGVFLIQYLILVLCFVSLTSWL